MVQSILLFALGFLVAVLLALLLAPFLWRRAQRLMRRRLEALVPVTLDEVRADRDALRAEHAVAMRKLEVENEDIRKLDAEHLIEISRGREMLKSRANALKDRDEQIIELRRLIDRLARQLRSRERDLSAIEVSHRVASREVASKRDTLEAISRRLEAAETESTDTVGALTLRLREVEQLTEEIATGRVELESARGRMRSLESDLDRAKANLVTERQRSLTLENQLTRQREWTKERDARLGERDAGMDTLRTERDQGRERIEALQGDLTAARREADALRHALEETDGTVREEIAALAAQVAALVAELEGGESPVRAVLDADGGGLGERMAALIRRAGHDATDDPLRSLIEGQRRADTPVEDGGDEDEDVGELSRRAG